MSWPAMTIYCRGAERLCAGVPHGVGLYVRLLFAAFQSAQPPPCVQPPPHGGAFCFLCLQDSIATHAATLTGACIALFASINLGLYKHPYGHESFVVIIQVGDIRLCALFEISSYLSFHMSGAVTEPAQCLFQHSSNLYRVFILYYV